MSKQQVLQLCPGKTKLHVDRWWCLLFTLPTGWAGLNSQQIYLSHYS